MALLLKNKKKDIVTTKHTLKIKNKFKGGGKKVSSLLKINKGGKG